MKQTIKTVIVAVLFLCVGIVGCDDKDSNPCSNYSKSEKSKIYEYNLGSFGDEEGAGIIKQAQHFKVSNIDREEGTYYYQPQDGFIGADSVKIEVSEGSHVGGSDRGRITRYKIKFEITECGMKATVTEYKKHRCCLELYGEVGIKEDYNEEGVIVYAKEYEEFAIKTDAEELRLLCPPLEDDFCQEGLKVKIKGQLFEGTEDETVKKRRPKYPELEITQ